METPRARFRAFLDSGGRRWILPALAGSGLAFIATQIVVAYTDEEMKVRTSGVPASYWYGLLLVWPAMTVICTLINALLLRWTGRWMGGESTVRGLLIAIAWAVMPVALTSPLVAAEAIALLRGATSPEQAGGLAAVAERVSGSLFTVTSILSIFRMVVAISEAQRFSKMKAVGNVLLANLPFLAVALAFAAAATNR